MTALISAALFILVQIVKKYITPKFGDTGLHIFIFTLALIAFGIQSAMTVYPGFKELAIKALEFLVGSMAVYEILWKQVKNSINVY